jgi:2,5-dioxopentanoate dehydrogenase
MVGGRETFHARSPLDSSVLEPAFHMTTEVDVDAALDTAETAFATYRQTTGEARAAFLERIADGDRRAR